MDMDLPRTPIKSVAKEETIDENSSIVSSPAYDINDNHNTNSNLYQMKGYSHGLSSKKKPDRNLLNLNFEREHTPTIFSTSKMSAAVVSNEYQVNKSFDNISDLSLDFGRNDTEKSDNNQKVDLDELDINKMFETNSKPLVLNHSPLKIDLESPSKPDETDNHIDDENDQPRKKLKLDIVPNLGNVENNDINDEHDNQVTTPVAIQMLESKEMSSPFLHPDSDDNNYSSTRNNSISLSSSHKLTPVHDQHQSDNDNLENNNIIDMVSKRNDELVDNLHRINSKINSISLKYDKLNRKYNETNNVISSLKEQNGEMTINLNDLVIEKDALLESKQTLKTKLKEVRDEIKMLNSNQNLLQNKYDNVFTENEKAKEVKELLERQIKDLEDSLLKNEEIHTDLESSKYQLNETIEKLNEEKETLIQEKGHTLMDVESYKGELSITKEQLIELQNQLDKFTSSEQENSDDLKENVKNLTSERDTLETKLNELTDIKDKEIEHLNNSVTEFESIINTTKDELKLFKESAEQLTSTLKERDQEVSGFNKKFEEVNDECKIRIAEVTELNIEIESLKESKMHLDETNNRLLEEIELKKQEVGSQQDNFQKASMELESLQIKNSNVENEHLEELENLHKAVTSLEESLKKNYEDSESLKTENDKLKLQLIEANNGTESKLDREIEIRSLNSENELKQRELEIRISELESLKKQSDEDQKSQEDKLKNLTSQVDEWKKKLDDKEKDTNKRLRLLAEDLYHQYSSKHEQKVKSLKKTYEKKYQSEIEKLGIEKNGLKEEIERLTTQINTERDEKRELLRSMETDQ